MRKKILIVFVLLLLVYIACDKIFYACSIYDSSPYEIIKEDTNEDYEGVGQEKVHCKDGYFTTFTTDGEHPKRYIEYKQNGDASWSENDYWNGTMAENGCGLVAMSIVLSGYDMNYTPEDLRQKYYLSLDYSKMSKELSSVFGIENSDFYYDLRRLSSDYIENHLETNRPVIVCVWDKYDSNRWTTSSHYMVLLATDGKGKVYVSNPNGGKNDSKSSGWYDIDEITPYIAKALYIEEY